MNNPEKRILKNQIEIMWTLSYLLSKAAPELVGRNGELDVMREDLRIASMDTKKLLAQMGK